MFYATESQPSSSRMLRSFRSQKNLKAESRRQQPAMQITHVSYEHVRKGSECSSVGRSSIDSTISRPSTSRTDLSSSVSSVSTIEWDPLRLHPTKAAAPTAPLPERKSEHGLRGVRSYYQLRSRQHPSFRSLQAEHTSELEIHAGFDFGFAGGATSASPASYPNARPAPPVSAWSYSTAPTPGGSFMDDDEDDDELSPTDVVDDHGLTPRPQHHYRAAGDADYFMKRGGWKRRGIVFSPGITMAGEDECFDLEQ